VGPGWVGTEGRGGEGGARIVASMLLIVAGAPSDGISIPGARL
jgi:hypothetical protein